MKSTDIYNFDFPSELIAQVPAHPRDHARLLVYSLSSGKITDSVFYELPRFLPANTTLVLNNSKVENCRWLFDEGNIELFVIEKSDAHTIRSLVRPGKKFRLGDVVKLTDWLTATVMSIDNEGIRTIRLSQPHSDERLIKFEHIPLPPYIKQNDKLADEYQTVFARNYGSLAAPTAGLHFTEELLRNIRDRWPVAEVTLDVGLGTFAKLTEENLRSNKLHEEKYSFDSEAADKLTIAAHRTAVGTTALRTLESAISSKGKFETQTKETDIFIRPGYKFKAVDALITNFHLPSTSLIMLVAAFLADKRSLSESEAAKEIQSIYSHAVEQGYRFYSFGDAMLII